jgi:hypothetical protein
MSDNDRARASIDATLTEIGQGHAALGIPVEEDEFLEAWEIIDRLERHYQEARAKAWADRWT